jgi:hypothetical protein
MEKQKGARSESDGSTAILIVGQRVGRRNKSGRTFSEQSLFLDRICNERCNCWLFSINSGFAKASIYCTLEERNDYDHLF